MRLRAAAAPSSMSTAWRVRRREGQQVAAAKTNLCTLTDPLVHHLAPPPGVPSCFSCIPSSVALSFLPLCSQAAPLRPPSTLLPFRLTAGTKWYGQQLHVPLKTPHREDDPPIPPPMFYFALQARPGWVAVRGAAHLPLHILHCRNPAHPAAGSCALQAPSLLHPGGIPHHATPLPDPALCPPPCRATWRSGWWTAPAGAGRRCAQTQSAASGGGPWAQGRPAVPLLRPVAACMCGPGPGPARMQLTGGRCAFLMTARAQM